MPAACSMVPMPPSNSRCPVLDGGAQAIVLNAQIVDRARLVCSAIAACGVNRRRQRGTVQIMSDKRSKHRGLLMAGIAGGVGDAEAAVLAHAADIAGGAALGVVDLAVKQTDHRGHALVGMSRLVGVTVSPMSRVALSALTIERWAESGQSP